VICSPHDPPYPIVGATVKLGWLSDIHLNFLSVEARSRFFDDLSKRDVDGWLITGDIGEAVSILPFLKDFAVLLPVKSFFVLGNHDFYRGSIGQVRAEVKSLIVANPQLTWLTDTAYLELSAGVALVGDDGWSDGRLGDALGTPVELNDFVLIRELSGHTRPILVQRLNRLGDESAARLAGKLQDAASRYARVLVLTHVPPFEGACWHEGKTSWPDWLPWFTCAAVGDAIMETAQAHPQTQFLVLCGHTHSPGRFAPSPNLVVYTAGAEYGRPSVQGFIQLEDDADLHIVLEALSK
jgi:predicted phosphohydrolase